MRRQVASAAPLLRSTRRGGISCLDTPTSLLFTSSSKYNPTSSFFNPRRHQATAAKENKTKDDWEVIIGLEVHAQIVSKTKLFSGSETTFGAPPNEKVSIVDVAYPGVLPAVKAGLVLNGKINHTCRFDRKHYFYCDLPQGYQITQKDDCIITGGHVVLDPFAKEQKKIRIHHVQLEQDSGKSHHDQDPHLTLVDYNRAGIGLLEIVSMPDIRTPKEATTYLARIGSLLQAIGVTDPKTMEKSALRCDVNVSVHRVGTPWGTRCEVKNVNSLRSVHKAIEYETQRQIALLNQGKEVDQETRYFDAGSGTTIRARAKEDEVDYRYFPEPDLPTVVIDEAFIEHVKANLPELPDDKLARLMKQYGLNFHDASVIMETNTPDFFEQVVKVDEPKDAAVLKDVAQLAFSYTANEMQGYLIKANMPIQDCPITPKQIRSIIDMIRAKKISGTIGKKVLEEMFDQADSQVLGVLANEIVEKKGWQLADTSGDNAWLDQFCKQVVDQNPQELEKYLKGKLGVKQFFVGQVMKLTKGKARPEQIQEILEKYLK